MREGLQRLTNLSQSANLVAVDEQAAKCFATVAYRFEGCGRDRFIISDFTSAIAAAIAGLNDSGRLMT